VPRKILTDGYQRSVYKRYAQYPIKKKYDNFFDADNNYKNTIKDEFQKSEIHLFEKLINLSNKYRSWIKNFDTNFTWN
jgi:hypothetical protein